MNSSRRLPARPVEPQEKQRAVIEIKVPDIGDYSDVPVIEVLVAVGDSVAKDQGLVTLESDKATLEVPSSAAGVVKELKVKVGDSLSVGNPAPIAPVATGVAGPAGVPPASAPVAPTTPGGAGLSQLLPLSALP